MFYTEKEIRHSIYCLWQTRPSLSINEQAILDIQVERLYRLLPQAKENDQTLHSLTCWAKNQKWKHLTNKKVDNNMEKIITVYRLVSSFEHMLIQHYEYLCFPVKRTLYKFIDASSDERAITLVNGHDSSWDELIGPRYLLAVDISESYLQLFTKHICGEKYIRKEYRVSGNFYDVMNSKITQPMRLVRTFPSLNDRCNFCRDLIHGSKINPNHPFCSGSCASKSVGRFYGAFM